MVRSTIRYAAALGASLFFLTNVEAQEREPFRYRVPLFGNAAGEAVVSPDALTFPDRQVGQTSASQTVQVSNTGGRNVNFSGIGIETGAAHFTQSHNCSVLAPTEHCVITVQFRPGASGAVAGTLVIRHDGGASTTAVLLTGRGLAASATLTPPTFAATMVGTPRTASAVLTNTGIGPVALQTPSVSGAPFKLGSNGCGASLAAGASCDIEVSFTPSARGQGAGLLRVDTGAGLKVVDLVGEGLQGRVVLVPETLTFPVQQLSTTSAERYVTVTNTGSAPLDINGVGMLSGGGEFNQTNACGDSLAVGGSCIVSVAFTPARAGARAGRVGIATNGDGATHFEVGGQGVLAAAVDSASFTQTAVTTGQAATFNWSTSNAASAAVACSGSVAGSKAGVSGTLVLTAGSPGVGRCEVTATSAQGISTTSTAQISVVAAPTVSSAVFLPASVANAGASTFSWATTNGVSASVTCAAPAVGVSSGLSGILPMSTSGYGLGTCTVTVLNAAGTAATRSATLSVAPPYSYNWAASGYTVSSGCGYVDASRSVWCQRSDGATVSDAYCGASSRPSSWTTTTDYSACRYDFSYGGWSTPAACGSTTSTRSATCVRSDGATVADYYCGSPATSQAATDYSACGYTANVGSWSGCSASCGGGTQTRSVSCIRTDGASVATSYCGSPSTAQSCNSQACASYSWSAVYGLSGCVVGNFEAGAPMSGTCFLSGQQHRYYAGSCWTSNGSGMMLLGQTCQ